MKYSKDAHLRFVYLNNDIIKTLTGYICIELIAIVRRQIIPKPVHTVDYGRSHTKNQLALLKNKVWSVILQEYGAELASRWDVKRSQRSGLLWEKLVAWQVWRLELGVLRKYRSSQRLGHDDTSWSKVNVWNVNFARAITFIFDTRTDVLVKVSKFLRQKMCSVYLSRGPYKRLVIY